MRTRAPDPKGSMIVLLLVAVILLPNTSFAILAPLTDDTYTASGSPGSNFGGKPALSLSPTTTTFLKFNLTTLPGCPATCPPGSDVAKASLTVFVNKVSAPAPLMSHRSPALGRRGPSPRRLPPRSAPSKSRASP